MRIVLSIAAFAGMALTEALKRATFASARLTLSLADAITGAPPMPPPLEELDSEYFEEQEAAQ